VRACSTALATSSGSPPGPRDSATLVRGADAFGHFELEPRPGADLDPAMLALHAEISDRQAKILYRGTSKTSF